MEDCRLWTLTLLGKWDTIILNITQHNFLSIEAKGVEHG